MEQEKEIKIPENLYQIQQDIKFEVPQTIPQYNIYDDGNFLKAISSVPTTPPVNALDKFRLYINGATKRLYVYDTINSSWLYTTLT